VVGFCDAFCSSWSPSGTTTISNVNITWCDYGSDNLNAEFATCVPCWLDQICVQTCVNRKFFRMTVRFLTCSAKHVLKYAGTSRHTGNSWYNVFNFEVAARQYFIKSVTLLYHCFSSGTTSRFSSIMKHDRWYQYHIFVKPCLVRSLRRFQIPPVHSN
jgi:hypothetical protein